MMRGSFRIVGAVLLLALCALAAEPADDETQDAQAPRESGLVEHAERGLVQLDVSVRGPWEAIRDLKPGDFDLVVNGQTMKNLVVDRLCTEPAASGSRGTSAPAEAAVPAARPRASFLFYFDQFLLNLAGRQTSIDLARRMIPGLVSGGGRVAIVSSGKKLDNVVELTDDTQALLDGLDRLEQDRDQWIIYPTQEDERIREVLDAQRTLGDLAACSTARRLYMEEFRHTDKALRLFALALGQLASLDPPKVVFYFADIMRRDAGAHYLTYVPRCSAAGQESQGGAFGTEFAIDRVIEQAAAQGTRVYTVRGEGLVAPSDASRLQGLGRGSTNFQRYSQAGDSLAGMALETGGHSFLNGESAPRILSTVEDDLGCMYLISFDPAGLPEDRLLRVLLRTTKPKVKAFTRGQMVLQSESARRTSRLMAAFVSPKSMQTDVPLTGAVIPTGFDEGRYSAMVQIRTAGSPLPQSVWDIGASMLTRGTVKGEASTRIRVDQANVPIVFEAEMTFRPGPFELVLVAHEQSADQLGTERMEGAWPVRDDGPAITPIAVVQPGQAVFVRAGEARTSGAIVLGQNDLLRTDRPTALIGLVCGGPAKNERYTLERVLVGDGEAPFQDLEIDLSDEPCAQFRDMIQAGTMTEGSFTYRVRLVRDGEPIAVAERRFGARDASQDKAADDSGGSGDGTP